MDRITGFGPVDRGSNPRGFMLVDKGSTSDFVVEV